jgi:hypothetical protein
MPTLSPDMASISENYRFTINNFCYTVPFFLQEPPMPNRTMPENLASLSRVMAWLSGAGLILYPLMVAAIFVFPGGATDWMMYSQDHLGAALNANVPIAFRLAALACEAAPAALVLWALWSLRQLFLRYASGDVFSNETLQLLHNVAVAIFAQVIVAFVAQGPMSFLLTYPLGHGHRDISLSLGSDDVFSVFMAGVVLVIARVMAVARRMADENESFV